MNVIENSTVLVTGANRGIGRALVAEALKRGAQRVYAGTRKPFTHEDERVVPLLLDVTNAAQVAAAALAVDGLDILINNAGVAVFDDLSEGLTLERHLEVNFLGMHRMIQAFLPALARSHGSIVNVLSLAGLASLPVMPAYSASKAAAFSLTQSYRALLAARGVSVHAVVAGPVDTDMSRDIPVPKASPESVAHAIFTGIAHGDDEIFPDSASAALEESWRNNSLKALEKQFATFVQAQVAS